MAGDKKLNAYLDLTLSMLFLGSTLVIAKTLIITFPIFILLAIRFFIGTVFFVINYFLLENWQKTIFCEVNKRDWMLLFWQSFFGAFLFNIFILLGMKFTTASSAAIITSTIPAFITGFSFLILKEIITKEKLIAIILCIVGLLFINVDLFSMKLNIGSLKGNGLILLAVISGAYFPICIKLLGAKISPKLISLFFNFFGLLLFIPLAIYQVIGFQFNHISFLSWLLVILYSFLANILYVLFWNRGLIILPASTASIFVAIMPISASILAYLFLKETLTILQIVGMSFIIFSIIIAVYSFNKRGKEFYNS